MSGVTVSMASLKRSWRETYGEVWLLLETAVAEEEATAAAWEAVNAAQLAEEAVSGDEPRIGGNEVVASPRGPILVVSFCDDVSVLQGWVEHVVADLGVRGISGRLRPVGLVQSIVDRTEPTALSAAFCVRTDPELIAVDRQMHNDRMSDWDVSLEDTERLLATLVPWCTQVGGKVYLRRSAVQFQVDPARLVRMAALALSRPSVSITSAASAALFRRTVLDAVGEGTAAAETGQGWRADLDALLGLLTDLAPLLDQAVVRRAKVINGFRSDVLNGVQPVMPYGGAAISAGDMMRDLRPSAVTRVPDAYGVQILTGAHLAHANDLSSWVITSVAADRYLVQAVDLEAWFAHPEPDRDTLARARADFGDLILSPFNTPRGRR